MLAMTPTALRWRVSAAAVELSMPWPAHVPLANPVATAAVRVGKLPLATIRSPVPRSKVLAASTEKPLATSTATGVAVGLTTVAVAPLVSVSPPRWTWSVPAGWIVSRAAAPLAVTRGASAPGSAVIVVGPVTLSVCVAAVHVAPLAASSHAGVAGARAKLAVPVWPGVSVSVAVAGVYPAGATTATVYVPASRSAIV